MRENGCAHAPLSLSEPLPPSLLPPSLSPPPPSLHIPGGQYFALFDYYCFCQIILFAWQVLEVAALIVLFLTIVLAGFIVKWGRLALDLPLSVGALADAGEEAEAAAVEAQRILVHKP